MYKENPKTKGSGIICVIPQKGRCPNDCEDCFFQSGRSYLEPLDENTPNIPPFQETIGRVVRVNDGNDSNIDQTLVRESTKKYQHRFFNTSIMRDINCFEAPIVLTLNPGIWTDKKWHRLLDIPKNLMFVRIRTNTWNIFDVVYPAIDYYTELGVSVVLTFMAYFDTQENIPEHHRENYVFRKRTLNSYNAITTKAWEEVMEEFKYNKLVHSCGKIEGEKGDTHCMYCGNCIREFFVTKERMKNGS